MAGIRTCLRKYYTHTSCQHPFLNWSRCSSRSPWKIFTLSFFAQIIEHCKSLSENTDPNESNSKARWRKMFTMNQKFKTEDFYIPTKTIAVHAHIYMYKSTLSAWSEE
ncbi:uncharacterized protein LOC134711290 [Mytilus trossulus]|uniref:uncharacterized protein LOC134711290 n=1 Tax=Mytilus trossulus TaxID=6551 RepID=UPI003007C1AA